MPIVAINILLVRMQLPEIINNALGKKTTTACVWLLACFLLFAAHIHISNMLGWNLRPWSELPLLWQAMDILLLSFDLTVAMGLIYRRVWAVIAFFAGMLILQIIPYTLFRTYFISNPADENLLNSLLGVEVTVLVLFAVLIFAQGRPTVIPAGK